jgi:hypothetical protein
VIIMLQQKTKPAAKKPLAARASVATASKPKTAVNTAAKKAATAAKKVPEKTTASAVKKSAAPAAGRKLLAKKTATTRAEPSVAGRKSARPPLEEHYRLVETAAYFIAERNGFQGHPTDHWTAAELEIAARLGTK